jgi:hypothetical protein
MPRVLKIAPITPAVVVGPAAAAKAGGMPETTASPGEALALALAAVILVGVLLWGAIRAGIPPGGREGPKRYS